MKVFTLINFQKLDFLKLCVKQTTSRLNCWPEWSAEHKFQRNEIIRKFMTIKNLLYDTENVLNLCEKDLISESSVKIAIKSNISYFPNELWRRFVMVQTFCWNNLI